jgi:hypothetical protein
VFAVSAIPVQRVKDREVWEGLTEVWEIWCYFDASAIFLGRPPSAPLAALDVAFALLVSEPRSAAALIGLPQ